MPARIVLVHDDLEFANDLMEELGPDVVLFTNPIQALKALTTARTIGVLITRMRFSDSQPVGLSLARLARAARPAVRVIFTGAQHYREFARGLGEYIVEPVNALHVSLVIEWLSLPEDARLSELYC